MSRTTDDFAAMSRDALDAESRRMATRIRELDHYEQRSGPQQAEFETLAVEYEAAREVGAEKARAHRVELTEMIMRGDPGIAIETPDGAPPPENLRHLPHLNPRETPIGNRTPALQGRDAVMRIVDGHVRSGVLPDHGAEVVERVVSHGSERDRSFASRWVQATGSDAYMRAFSKWFMDSERGHLRWDSEEQAAFNTVLLLRDEQRAMGLTDDVGGYGTLPYQLDPTVILSNSGTVNPLRAIARKELTVTDTWKGVTSAGATASWDAEAEEVSDDSPTLAQPGIPVNALRAFIPFSREVEQDWAGGSLVSQLAEILTDSADRLMSTAYTVGTGVSHQPKGVITAVAADSGSVVAPATAETFASADVYNLIQQLPARWRAKARWMANLSILNKVDVMETSNGAKLFPNVGDANPILLRRPLHENSEMDGTYDATATAAHNYLMLVGDFSQFVIVDKVFGTSIELIPNLFGDNGRPTGQRGAFLFLRTGSDCTLTSAFRLLDIPTAA